MKSIELFAGAGGLGVGLELAGFEHLMVIDNEGLEVTDQKIITEANNSIDSQDYIEEFDSSEFH